MVFNGYSQQTIDTKEYSRNPLWIEMIKDTAVNYFEAEKAFTAYFSKHELPGDEHEIIGEYRHRSQYTNRQRRKMQEENQMRIEVKKYKHWKMTMLPYVQPDGHILTPSERINIHSQLKSQQR